MIDNSEKMKFERKDEMCPLKKEISMYLFDFTQRKAPRDQWIKYEGEFIYDKKKYNLACECRWDNIMFTYRNLEISEQRIIEIDIQDMVKAGLIH
jgi:hypothetical protein